MYPPLARSTLEKSRDSAQKGTGGEGRTPRSPLYGHAPYTPPTQSREACLRHAKGQPVKSQLLRKPGSTPSVPVLNHLLDGISWALNNFPCRNAVHHGLVQPPNNTRYERHFGARGPPGHVEMLTGSAFSQSPQRFVFTSFPRLCLRRPAPSSSGSAAFEPGSY